MSKSNTPEGFKAHSSRGFQMTFSNGWTVSVMFGAGNYCDNQSHSLAALRAELRNEVPVLSCPNAEIAAWDQNGKWHWFGSDEVKGYCTPDEVGKFITMISTHGGIPMSNKDEE